MPPTKGTYVPMAESSGADNSYKDATLEFSEPPVTEFRYRYLSEFSKGSHGNLKSINYKASRDKSRNSNGFPTVRVHNCGVPFQLLTRLYTPDKTRIHPHKLIESTKFESPTGCIFFSGNPTAPGKYVDVELANLNVLHVGKEQVDNYTRQAIQAEIIGIDGGTHSNEYKVFHEMCKEFKKEIENSVVLRIDLIVEEDKVSKTIRTIYSEQISNSKTQLARQLVICRMSKVTGTCDGGEEVYILTSKFRPEDINKSAVADSDILVVFSERNEMDEVVWREFAEIIYCHNLSALIFKTPPYRYRNIGDIVDVTIQLIRRSDPESFSEELAFRYVPNEESEIRRKRAKHMPHYPTQGCGDPLEGAMAQEEPVAEDIAEEVVIPLSDPDLTQARLNRISNDPDRSSPSAGHLAHARAEFPSGVVCVENENSAGMNEQYECTGDDEPDGFFDAELAAVFDLVNRRLASDPTFNELLDQTQTMHPKLKPGSSDPMLSSTSGGSGAVFLGQGGLITTDSGGSVSRTPVKSDAKSVDDKYSTKSAPIESRAEMYTGEVPLSQMDGTAEKPFRQDNLVAYKLALQTAQCLHNYAKTGNIKLLLMSMRHLIAIQDDKGDNSLHASVLYSQQEAFCHLVEVARTIANYDIINMSNRYNQTPLHVAICTQQKAAVAILLNHGSNPNFTDKNGNTAVHLAAQHRNAVCLSAILDRNYTHKYKSNEPDLNALNYAGLSPLHVAIEDNSTSAAKQLCDAGCDVNLRERTSGRTALHMAVEKKDLGIIGYLLNARADPDRQMFNGNTTLHLAVIQDRADIVRLLMSVPADAFIENNESALVTEDEVDDEPEAAGGIDEADQPIDRGLTPMDLAVSEEVRRLLRKEKVPEAAASCVVSQEAPVAAAVAVARKADPEKGGGSGRNLMDSGIGLSGMDLSSGMSIDEHSHIASKEQRDTAHSSVAATLSERQKDSLARLLEQSDDWVKVAVSLDLDAKEIDDLRSHKSPTKALLEMIESQKDLVFYLDAANIKEAVKIVEESQSSLGNLSKKMADMALQK